MTVDPGGYAWWYVDALSDDGRFGLSLIAFVGSVFSPYYALALRRRAADPENHVALNVALYGGDGYRWSMTERGRAALHRDRHSLSIGPSRLAWEANGSLSVTFDEIALPLPRRIRGRVVIYPDTRTTTAFHIDSLGRHIWQPIAPRARVEVALENPLRTWTGAAYVDHNRGCEPLAAAFRSWNWSRSIEVKRTRIFYDVVRRDGSSGHLHLEYPDGAETPIPLQDVPPLTPMQRSLWRLERSARSETRQPARLLEPWEDGPFYARSLITQTLGSVPVRAVHEAVSLDRFSRGIVQAMLPFRMPRRRRG